MAKAQVKQKEEPVEIHMPAIMESNEDRWEKERIAESRLVKGIFQDNELKGGSVRFPFKKFRGDKIVDYHFIDGQEYEIPLAVVKHLNNNCAYVQDAYVSGGLMGPDGKPLKNPNAKKFHRFTFKVSEYT